MSGWRKGPDEPEEPAATGGRLSEARRRIAELEVRATPKRLSTAPTLPAGAMGAERREPPGAPTVVADLAAQLESAERPPPPVAAEVVVESDARSDAWGRVERLGAAIREVGLRVSAAGRAGRGPQHRTQARVGLVGAAMDGIALLGELAVLLRDDREL